MAIGWTVLLVGVGGALGANLRYWLAQLIQSWDIPGTFPWATFFINVTGSLLLGLIAAHWRRDHDAYLFWAIGFCGGYTTYSTFSLETLELLKQGQVGWALLNVIGSAVAGVLAVWLALRGARVG